MFASKSLAASSLKVGSSHWVNAFWRVSTRSRNSSGTELECERPTGKEGFERAQGRATLLAPGGEQAAQAAEGVRAAGAAEGARDLLLDLDHAQVTLRLVVVKGHREV